MSVKTSIIIISYNEKKYLQECLDSCIAQDKNNDIEIIIGDDGSTDGSIEIIKQFQQNYPKTVNYFINDRNDGISIPSIRVSNTIKKALNISKGDYCVIISGDDIFLDKDFITKAKIIFDNDNKKKYSSVVSTKFNYFWDNGKTELKQCKCNSNKIYWALFYKHLSCFVFNSDNFLVSNPINLAALSKKVSPASFSIFANSALLLKAMYSFKSAVTKSASLIRRFLPLISAHFASSNFLYFLSTAVSFINFVFSF